MVSSRALASVVGEALGISHESAQLHLRTIRAGGEISFKGYGSSAAAMTSLDAARLLIAAAGSLFAKDSLRILQQFAKLKPSGRGKTRATLEDTLAKRIDEMRHGQFPVEMHSDERWRNPITGNRPYGSPHLAENALQLISPMGTDSDQLPRFAILRWLDEKRNSRLQSFGSEQQDEAKAQIQHVDEILYRYKKADFIQIRVVKRSALQNIAQALGPENGTR